MAVLAHQICFEYDHSLKLFGRKEGEVASNFNSRSAYAQLRYDSGVPITLIIKLLVHADTSTAPWYLDLDLDLESTISEFIPLEWSLSKTRKLLPGEIPCDASKAVLLDIHIKTKDIASNHI